MTLYHFTSSLHWPEIQARGGLQPSESNIGSPLPSMRPHGERVGPDVVWMLDTPELEYPHGLENPNVDKTTTRIELDDMVERMAIRWKDWAYTTEMHPTWREAFLRGVGGEEAAEHWYIWPAVIRLRRFVQVVDVPSGEVIWRRG